MIFTFTNHPLIVISPALTTLAVTEPQQKYVLACLGRMITEITDDVRHGRVPATVSSFGDLHDFVDANEYGGFCEENDGATLRGIDLGNSIFPARDDDEDTLQTQELMVVVDEMQTAVNQWIVNGGITSMLEP